MTDKAQTLHASASEAITNNVRVEVEARFAPDRSQTFENEWVFIYTVRITNEGDDTVQLLGRHWVITDATGHTEEIRRPGVMRGTYQMVTEDGEHFDVEIAPFSLHEPYTVH